MKGWLDNFGKAENANDSNVSFSEGFVGLGYNTKGRNYSPAWGGQFQDGGKLIPVSPIQQITGQASSISPTVPYLQTKDPVEFYQSWIQSPEYARRQLLTGYSPSAKDESLFVPSAAASRQTRLESLQNIDPITYSTRQPSESRPGVYGSSSTVNINPLDYIDTNRGMVEAHELAHIAGAMESEGTTRPGVMSGKEQEIFKKSMLPMKEPVLSGSQGSQQREASKRALEDFEHSKKPKELKADLDALRFTMYDKGIYDITKGQKFTESDFEKAKQSLGKDRVFKRLENRVGKKNFVNLMNTIAKVDEEELPLAMGGMSIPGSVGFTYARTAGSAPSKGKYAKKTMASAQIGKNIEKDETNIDTNIASKIAGLELKQNPEYHYHKYLQNQPQLKQAPGRGEELMRQGLGYADVVTDVMQMGNFIPLPQTQTIGKIGNIAGSIVDLTQAAMAVYNKDYQSALINAASAGLPFAIKNPNILGGYNRSAKYAFGNRSSYLPVDKLYGRMTAKQLLGNRALLGTLGAETAYDAGAIGPVKKEYGGEIPSAQKGKNDIERISINDPRYPEMYKNRQVGLSYDGTISLPDLDEVTVTAPRSYTMDSLRDFTTAALYGIPENLMKLEQVPTAALAETVAMLTGKPYNFSNVNPNFGQFGSGQRDLSNVLGYENPEGFLQNAANIGLSAIDPTLIGGGSKLVGKQLGKNLTKQVGEVVNRSITPIGYDPFTVLASPAELLTPNFLKFKPKTHATKNRFDAWRLYNGLEPNYDTFSKNADNTLAINDFRIGKEDLQSIVDNPKSSFGTMEVRPEFNFGAVHGNGWITKGVDEQGRKFVDFTDTWDLQPLQPIKGLPKKLKEFEVSSLTGGQPFDLKNRIYYDDAGNFFDHNNNKLIEKVESFSKGVVKENEAADVVMLTTPKIADEKQMDVLKDWENAQNNKYFKGAGVGAVGTLGGLSYMHKKAKEKEKSEESKNEVPKKQNGGEMKFYQNGLDWKPKSMQDGGKEDFIGKATKFVSEEISDPVTTAALGLLNMVKPISNPEIYKTVRPVDYPNALKLPIHAYNYLMGNETEPLKTKSGKPHLAEEFWATAMGVPVERQYLKESKYKPSVAKDPDAKYYTIRDVIDDYQLMNLTKDLKPGEKMEMNGLLPIIDTKWYSENANTDKNVNFEDIDPLQRFTLQKSPDGSYISIYDKYDFNNPALNRMMNPIEIYDRFYLPKKKDGGPVNSKNPKDNKEVDRVSISDPRYPELYKNRQVGSYYDGAFTLPDLPEVVVTGKDERLKEAMSQGSGRFLEGALGVISAPQVVTMDWLTGKQQTPSEAWGFQQPGGWLDSPTAFGKNLSNFGMDMALDPLNALGAGVVDDVIKTGAKAARTFGKKSIPQTLSPQMMADNLVVSTTPNVSTVSNPTGLPNTGNRELLEKLKQETIDRLSTSEGKRRLQRMIDKNFSKNNEGWGKPVEGWGEFFLEGLKNLELSGVKKMTPDDIIEDLKKLELLDKVEELSDWDAGFNRIDGTPVLYVGKKYSPYDYDVRQIFSHEIDGHFNQRHTATDLDDKLSKLELKDQADPPNLDADLEDVQPSIFGSLPSVSDFKTSMNYFLKGSKGREKLAFASEVRRNLFERGITKSLYDTLTPEILKKHFELYNKTGGDKYTLRLYELMKNSPKNFKILSEVLNDLPAVALPVAGGAAAVTSGLNQNQPEQKQKNGGITKDNKGYWNPENWGKPVEIDSNMITMQGVYEPLLGISDTGDAKLMKPGENYKFKGKKVTEFPVAELGINQLDAQPMKKLNQLLNFTNNPDKDNWLDKYN